jgi:hypothetical protein
MTTNAAFAAHTRAATFALALSHNQISRVLEHHKVDELRRKYPWYQPRTVNFGKYPSDLTTDPGLALQTAWDWLGADSTDRSLIRKGLFELDLAEHEPGSNLADAPACRYALLHLTLAGALVAELLIEAGFEVDPARIWKVPPHPDARPVIDVGQDVSHLPPRIPDDRDPADGPFLASGPWQTYTRR